ncbi:MAG: hypothetical protein J6K22_08170 [Spirochaetaceae bacterium]|nr:hypothetical protein [Spirochaetaceae bacterium]
MSSFYRRFIKNNENKNNIEYSYIFGIENYQKSPTGVIVIDKQTLKAKVIKPAIGDIEKDFTEYLANKKLFEKNFPDSYTYATH